jgi:hypothetical protein
MPRLPALGETKNKDTPDLEVAKCVLGDKRECAGHYCGREIFFLLRQGFEA